MGTPNENCVVREIGQSVVHTPSALAALLECKCSFLPSLEVQISTICRSADFYASMIVGGSTETGLMATAERLLLPKVLLMGFLGALHQNNGSRKERVMAIVCDSL